MQIESIFVGNQMAASDGEGLDYSPPKDPLDSSMFQHYFASGSFPLLTEKVKEVEYDHNFSQYDLKDELCNEVEHLQAHYETESNYSNKHSNSGSLVTCAQTDNSRDNHLSKINDGYESLETGSKNYSDNASMVSELSGQPSMALSRDEDEQNAFLDSFKMTDLANQKVAKVILQLIDRVGFIRPNEWQQFSLIDKRMIKILIETLYGFMLRPADSEALIGELNALIMHPSKSKRNEEKLKKTVKKVNRIIMQAFAEINCLGHLEQNQLAHIVYAAYFGDPSGGGCQGFLPNIFGDCQGLSQKAFCRLVENKRYAEDFVAVLMTRYMPAALHCRLSKVTKMVALTRKKIQFTEYCESSVFGDLIKRCPWPLSDLMDGVNLCRNIIEKAK